MTKPIILKHNGVILTDFGFDSCYIDDIDILDDESIQRITKAVQFRPVPDYRDFEYGIGGFSGDKSFKIKNIYFADNDTSIIVKVSEV